MKNLLPLLSSLALVLSVAFSASGAPAAKEPEPSVVEVNAEKAAALIEKNGDPEVTVLDIRTPGEFESGHIKGAMNIDFRSEDFEAQLRKLDPAQPYLIHCRTGSRSTASLSVFKNLGFARIYHLEGGILAWEKAGKPVVK